MVKIIYSLMLINKNKKRQKYMKYFADGSFVGYSMYDRNCWSNDFDQRFDSLAKEAAFSELSFLAFHDFLV